MDYRYLGYESHPRDVIEKLVVHIEEYASWLVSLDDDDKSRMLADILGQHGVALKSAEQFAPLRPDDKGHVIDRDRNRKRILYYFPRTRAFARGTHFGNQSSFKLIADASDMIGIAGQLLDAGDFNRIVAGLEPVVMKIMMGVS